MSDDNVLLLAHFQTVLTEALYECDDLAEIRSRLRSLPIDSPYRAWSESFDDRMLSLAATLTKKWARHRS